jgi:DNA-directed RNA polymerase specialized sigma24 family protein
LSTPESPEKSEAPARKSALQDSLDELPDLSSSMLLVRQVRRGMKGAIDELLQRYQARMRRIIAIKMGASLRRQLDVDDILQEVFLIAFQKIDGLELRSKASILQWMAKIAENVVHSKVGYFSAQKRSAGKEIPLHELTASSDVTGIQISAPGTTPPQGAARSELQELVDRRVECLEPANYREAILLRDYQEHEWEEIRVLLGRPTVAAAQELHRRAHLKLLEQLLKHLDRPG